MQEAVASQLTPWGNFYVIVGSAAATLTGLMFIVITLVTSIRPRAGSSASIAAFSTPNVIHFCAALLTAATMSAPWHFLWYVSILLALYGLGGLAYIVVVIRRTYHQSYKPVLEDWIWHVIVPFISYAALVISAILLPLDPILTLFFIGTVMLLFLFIGIHNAWDNLTYMVTQYSETERQDQQ